MLATIPPTQTWAREILCRRFGLSGQFIGTLEELGAALQLICQQVQQIETHTLKQIRAALFENFYTGKCFRFTDAFQSRFREFSLRLHQAHQPYRTQNLLSLAAGLIEPDALPLFGALLNLTATPIPKLRTLYWWHERTALYAAAHSVISALQAILMREAAMAFESSELLLRRYVQSYRAICSLWKRIC